MPPLLFFVSSFLGLNSWGWVGECLLFAKQGFAGELELSSVIDICDNDFDLIAKLNVLRLDVFIDVFDSMNI